MADEIRDLDDVEAQAWAFVWAALAASGDEVPSVNADECVRLLRERRATRVVESGGSEAIDYLREDAATKGIAYGRIEERKAIVAWLREPDNAGREHVDDLAYEIESGEHDR